MKAPNYKYTFRIILAVIIMVIAVFFPLHISAEETQYNIETCEAMIANSRRVTKSLMNRSKAEGVTTYAHDSMQARTSTYKSNEKKVDKYWKMDIIDLIINGGTAAFGTVHMLAVLKQKFTGFWNLTREYNDKILSKGKVMYSDKIFYDTSLGLYNSVKEDVEKLSRNYVSFAAYIGGVNEMSTAELASVLGDINGCYNRIEDNLDRAYSTLWTYMQMRLGYWNSNTYYVRSMESQRDAIRTAFDGWMCAIEAMHVKKANNGVPIAPKYETYIDIQEKRAQNEKRTGERIDSALRVVRLAGSI